MTKRLFSEADLRQKDLKTEKWEGEFHRGEAEGAEKTEAKR